MQFDIFTLLMFIMWVSIFIQVISLIRRQMHFLHYFSISPLLLILLFCMARILFPVEFPFTRVIASFRILPYIQSLLYYEMIRTGFIQLSVGSIIVLVWISGIIFSIFKHIKSYYLFRRFVDFLPMTKEEHVYDIFLQTKPRFALKNTKIIIHDAIKSPAIFGLLRPVILLPALPFSDDELIGIFVHESAHYYYGHLIIKYITEFIRSCFWWNPCFRNLSLEMAHALEMHSDKKVCNKLDDIQQKKYLTCIANIADHIHASPRSITCSLVEEGNGEKLIQRYDMILNDFYRKKKKCNFLIILLLIMMFLLSYSFLLQPYSFPTIEDIGPCDDFFIETEEGHELRISNIILEDTQ